MHRERCSETPGSSARGLCFSKSRRGQFWFAQQVARHGEGALRPYQPWYVQKQQVSLHDITWAVRERLFEEGITPTVGIWEGVGVIHRLQNEKYAEQLPRAA